MRSAAALQLWAVDVSGHARALPDAAAVARALLPASEADTVARFVRAIDRARSLAGKLLLRLALCKLVPACGEAGWRALRFDKTREGRPFLVHPSVQLDFNISHDGDWVVLALHLDAVSRVGVDVMELALPHFERDVSSFVETMELALAPRETAWILAAITGAGDYEAQQREALRRLYDLWTHKEAYTKALGLGLGFDFRRLELRLGDVREHRSVRRALLCDGQEEARYVFTELLLPPGAERGQVPPTPGEGTGLPSQLVVAQGPVQEAAAQISPPVALQAAKTAGWLRIMTLGELLDSSRDRSNVTDKSWTGVRVVVDVAP